MQRERERGIKSRENERERLRDIKREIKRDRKRRERGEREELVYSIRFFYMNV